MKQGKLKLTFTGDAMVLLPELEASRQEDGSYCFASVLQELKPILQQSNYVCANLETPFAGQQAGYTSTPTSFNTPDSFASVLAGAGVHCVTTANNHTLDRGVEGMVRTLDVLDTCGMDHTGTYRSPEESERIFVREISGVRVAILSFTYGTNSEYNGCFLPDDHQYMIDLLKRQAHAETLAPIVRQVGQMQRINMGIRRVARRVIPVHLVDKFRTMLPMLQSAASRKVIDNVPDCEIGNPEHFSYVERLDEKIRKARACADYVVTCVHFGGQYNDWIGGYTRFMMNHLRSQGVDLVVGNHPHCILPIEVFAPDRFGVYALGNFCATPYWGYWADGALGEYSVLLHVYLDPETKKLSHSTCTVVKAECDADGHSRIRAVEDILRQERCSKRRKKLEHELVAVLSRLFGADCHPEMVDGEYLILRK